MLILFFFQSEDHSCIGAISPNAVAYSKKTYTNMEIDYDLNAIRIVRFSRSLEMR